MVIMQLEEGGGIEGGGRGGGGGGGGHGAKEGGGSHGGISAKEGSGGGGSTSTDSFTSLQAYLAAVKDTPTRLKKRMIAVGGCAEEEVAAAGAGGGGVMARKVGWLEVMAMGVGGMMGAGILVSTGQAAHSSAGPAVVLSFAIAGFSALLSALCYTEFAVSVPSAGGAFSYLLLGERIRRGKF